MHSRKLISVVLCVMFGISFALVLALGVTAWLVPFGTGEYRRSPDDRYTAHAGNMTRGTLDGRRVRYIELKLVRNSDEATVWSEEIVTSGSASIPSYGDRSQRFIRWLPDSSSFQVPVQDGLVRKVPIPSETQ